MCTRWSVGIHRMRRLGRSISRLRSRSSLLLRRRLHLIRNLRLPILFVAHSSWPSSASSIPTFLAAHKTGCGDQVVLSAVERACQQRSDLPYSDGIIGGSGFPMVAPTRPWLLRPPLRCLLPDDQEQ